MSETGIDAPLHNLTFEQVNVFKQVYYPHTYTQSLVHVHKRIPDHP